MGDESILRQLTSQRGFHRIKYHQKKSLRETPMYNRLLNYYKLNLQTFIVFWLKMFDNCFFIE